MAPVCDSACSSVSHSSSILFPWVLPDSGVEAADLVPLDPLPAVLGHVAGTPVDLGGGQGGRGEAGA